MTLVELTKVYDAGWMPIIPIDDKYSSSLIPSIYRWRPAMVTQIFKERGMTFSIVITTDRPVMSCGFIQI
jgi:hypothetical protein